jgi:hypothetical protein
MSTLREDFGLPNRLSGKSFANASKSIEKAFKDRTSIYDINTKQELMSRLKDMQEYKRSQLGLTSTNQKDDGGDENGIELPEDVDFSKINMSGMPDTFEKQSWFNNTFGKNSWLNKNSDNITGGIGLAASILGPMISNRRAMKSMQPPSKLSSYQIDEQQYQPNLIDRQQLMRNAEEQASTQRNFLSQTGGSWNQFASGLANLNSSLLNSTGNLMLQSNMADNQELARIQGLKSNVQQFNIQQREKTDEVNQQNMAAYYNTLATYKQAQGANIGSIGRSLFNLMQAKKYGTAMGNAALFQGIK